ncbi:hypothetical protein C8J57DRAFT_73281 [Mycena rebaudengoi]|nr:hypothetical protein C8J57DRAFT_73281 [Mycena rebaudengoi]
MPHVKLRVPRMLLRGREAAPYFALALPWILDGRGRNMFRLPPPSHHASCATNRQISDDPLCIASLTHTLSWRKLSEAKSDFWNPSQCYRITHRWSSPPSPADDDVLSLHLPSLALRLPNSHFRRHPYFPFLSVRPESPAPGYFPVPVITWTRLTHSGPVLPEIAVSFSSPLMLQSFYPILVATPTSDLCPLAIRRSARHATGDSVHARTWTGTSKCPRAGSK